MDRKYFHQQRSLKAYKTVPLNTPYHQSGGPFVNHSDEFEKLEYTLIEELNIPFLKVNEELESLYWSDSFIALSNIESAQLHNLPLNEIGLSNPFISFCADLAEESIVTEMKQEDDIEIGDSLLFIRAVPFPSNRTSYLFIEDHSLQKQFDNLLTYYHQLEAASHISAGVAHELRNPLSVIKGFLQLAQLTDGFNKYYDTIMSELDRMNGIIEDFLSVSRKKIERNRQSPSKIMCSLKEIMKAECLLHNVELIFDLTKTHLVVNVNESMIKQVMLNLLRNSIEAYGDSNQARSLKVTTRIKEKQYVISVFDNGKGMPESVLSKIDKPFFTTKETGTGVGIPLCKRIIEDHGGEFHIRSTYNVGTEVVICLPLE